MKNENINISPNVSIVELNQLKAKLFEYCPKWSDLLADRLECSKALIYLVFRKEKKDRKGIYRAAKELLNEFENEY